MEHRTAESQDNVRGALWVLGAAFSFTAMTSLVKLLGAEYPASLQAFYRQLAGFLILLPMIVRRGPRIFATRRPISLLFRSVAAVAAFNLAFYAYQDLPLAVANALSFTRAMWIVLFAVLFLRETAGPIRLGAVALGFSGVLMAVGPISVADVSWPLAAGLISAALFAAAGVVVKSMVHEHSRVELLAFSAACGLILALLPALTVWVWPTWPDLGLLMLMGGLGVVTQVCFMNGMRIGDASALAPLEYSRLILAIGVGYVVFGELPTAMSVAGMSVIAASALLITWREHQRRKRGAG